MVGGVLSYIARQLGDLDLVLQVALEASKHDFSLTRLEPIAKAWNRPFTVRNREQNQLFVDKVFVAHHWLRVVDEGVLRVECSKPVFPCICELFGER